ncbi:glucose dehydrogenase [Arachidicoccus ginsenosidimutans]|uniref:PQQ-dependent sugar dehydrogenase n=1 Tax=Arachidicoccus sp. BS20 TaxID=1850526 RepID=UPI0007F0EA64|nr:PQQ-dependent sugar dehydrogenase [Arachidicoccus sp. BS20]ANI89454.1 glucose dehydrogenase [Arachidicoccus sp. BS20]
MSSRLKLLTVATVLYVFAGCGGNSTSQSNNTVDSLPANSPETKPPVADYKPAFPGQTRAPEVKTQTPISITVIDTTLRHPWGICNLPDGRLLITEKFGTARIESLDGKSVKKITGFPKVIPNGQGGLLDINADPNFATNRTIYFDYSELQPDSSAVLAVAKATLSKDETKIENVKVIYRATPAYKGLGRYLQYGSRIVFDKDGNLFVSTGERSDDSVRVQAQWLSSSLGKIIHITTDGKPVHDASFPDSTNVKPEIYASGLRSPEGLVMNPQTGELWEAEFGPKGGDEVNIIHAGKNYGWPVITYGIEYRGVPVGDSIQQKAGMEQPIYYWSPSVSPSGIEFYNSDTIPEWKGNLFLGCLSGSHIDRLVIKDNKVVGEEWLFGDKGERFRALRTAKNGALYAITDAGKLYKIAKQ